MLIFLQNSKKRSSWLYFSYFVVGFKCYKFVSYLS